MRIQTTTIKNTQSEFKLVAKAEIKHTMFDGKDFEKVTSNSKRELQTSSSLAAATVE